MRVEKRRGALYRVDATTNLQTILKITHLTSYLVPPRWLFLKINTDEGISGWGEPIVEDRAHTVGTAVAELSDYLIGQDDDSIAGW